MAKQSFDTSRLLIDDTGIDPGLRFRIEEAYKSIRTNIMFSIIKKGCKTIVVSSSVPSEGKTTTAINLAISISQADQNVLLIDGDLRKPKIHRYFGIQNAPGLTNYIGDSVMSTGKKTDLFSVIHPTNYSKLSVLCSGSIPPNPAELLGSEPMAEFLELLSQNYDYIIIDSPPLNIVSDALPIIRESDGIVIVVRANESTHPELQKSLDALEFINAKILGFVVNFKDSSRGAYGYGYSRRRYRQYKYGYGYGYGYDYGYGYSSKKQLDGKEKNK